MKKERIDLLLVERGLSKDTKEALGLLLAGLVVVNDKRVDKAGDKVSVDADIRLKKRIEFASRGGYKLQKAIEEFGLEMKGAAVLDIGSSTGGFTDVCLKYGADRVYAVDVGSGLILERLRKDERVILLENTNFRTIEFDKIGEKVDFIVSDVSFISLTLIIPNAVQFSKVGTKFIMLIKPQFEAGRGDVEDGGLVTDKKIHLEVSKKVVDCAAKHGYKLYGFTTSPIKGAKGNVEYLAYFIYEEKIDRLENNIEIESLIL